MNKRKHNNNKRFTKGKKQVNRISKDNELDNKISTLNYRDAKAGNDPAWYSENAQLMKDVTSFSFNQPTGSIVQTNPSASVRLSDTQYAIPGVMSVKWMPSIGDGEAVNTAKFNIFSYVRHANSGAANYSAEDLMMYLIAMDSVYSFWAYLRRIYGICSYFSATNKYVPATLLRASNADYRDMIKNLPRLRALINTAALQAGAFCVPANMSYHARHIWMNSHVFSDSDSSKGQFYLFDQIVYYQYDDISQETGTALYPVDWSWDPGSSGMKPKTFDQMETMWNNLIMPIINSGDCALMSGDILKAFGDTGVVKLVVTPDDFAVVPEYNIEVLTQFANATLLSTAFASPKAPIIQQSVDNQLIYENWPNDVITAWSNCLLGKNILNLPYVNPTASDVMVATRLMLGCYKLSQGTSEEANNRYYYQFHKGSEVCLFATVFYYAQRYNASAPSQNYLSYSSEGYDLTTGTPSGFTTWLSGYQRARTIVSSFRFAPPSFWVIPYDSLDKGSYFNYPQRDYDNWTVIDDVELLNLHKTALLSEFSVPQMGAYTMKE